MEGETDLDGEGDGEVESCVTTAYKNAVFLSFSCDTNLNRFKCVRKKLGVTPSSRAPPSRPTQDYSPWFGYLEVAVAPVAELHEVAKPVIVSWYQLPLAV